MPIFKAGAQLEDPENHVQCMNFSGSLVVNMNIFLSS